jgi:hypothetical protein
MKIEVVTKILGHNSIKVTLDSYGTIIDELMLLNVKELKDKLSSSKERSVKTDNQGNSNAQEELINMARKASMN